MLVRFGYPMIYKKLEGAGIGKVEFMRLLTFKNDVKGDLYQLFVTENNFEEGNGNMYDKAT